MPSRYIAQFSIALNFSLTVGLFVELIHFLAAAQSISLQSDDLDPSETEMTQAPDDNAWLEQIRCPRYFDFEAALTIPCPNGSDTNPPLRDSVYESDEETRSFFQKLETDRSLHETPHPQENSPPRAEFRNLRPIYRHRPATSFEEYLQNFKDSKDSSPSRDLRTSVVQDINLNQQTPTQPAAKTSSTPKRHLRGKQHKTPTKGDIKPPSLDSLSTPKSKRNPVAQYGPSFQTSFGVTRQSAPNESVPLRRRRQPERITPPVSSVSSKSTSGGFGRVKCRKAIVRPEHTDIGSVHPPRIRREAGNASSPNKDPEKSLSREEGGPIGEKTEADLLQGDQDILRMMEEHNRRIQEKHAHNTDKEETNGLGLGQIDNANDQSHDRGRHIACITVRNASDAAVEKGMVRWDKSLTKQDMHLQQRASVSKGNCKSVTNERQNVAKKDGGFGSRVKADKESHSARNRRQLSSLVQGRKPRSCTVKDDSVSEEESLNELLKCENERVLEERKKRLPERRNALLLDKTIVLRTFEGQQVEHDRQRVPAKVDFTSADGNLCAGSSAFSETGQKPKADTRNRGKENSQEHPVSKSRQRGFKGFREKSKLAGSQRISPSRTITRPLSQRNHNTGGTRRRQPYTDKIKASERQKRLEKRLEEDLQNLLSQHNNRVKGNRRACGPDEK